MHRAEERELRLFLPGEHARVERELAPDPLGELGPVGRVADGGGEHGEVGDAVVGVDFAAVLGERREHPVDRGGGERPGRVDPLAEPRDGRAPHELGDPARGRDVGDEQPRRVGADVDDGHTSHGRGC